MPNFDLSQWQDDNERLVEPEPSMPRTIEGMVTSHSAFFTEIFTLSDQLGKVRHDDRRFWEREGAD